MLLYIIHAKNRVAIEEHSKINMLYVVEEYEEYVVTETRRLCPELIGISCYHRDIDYVLL